MVGWSAVRLIPDKTLGPEQMTVDFSVVAAVEGRWVDGRPQDFVPGRANGDAEARRTEAGWSSCGGAASPLLTS